jgi:hypothetical protein
MNVIAKFSEISGLGINYSKTLAVKIGFVGNRNYSLKNGKEITWQSEGRFTLLGMEYDLDEDEFTRINYENKIKDFEKTLNPWMTRNLTVYGKICILKSLALPKLSHLFSALPNPPEDMFRRIENSCFNFIWDGKPDKIKWTTMCNTYENGGFRMINIKYFCLTQKLTWIKRLLDDLKFADWKTLFLSDIQKYGRNYIWLIQNPEPSFLKNLNQFWKDVFKSWMKITSKTNEEPLSEPLYHNPHIQINKKSSIVTGI